MPTNKTFLIIIGFILPFVTIAADKSVTTENEKSLIAGKTFLARVISPKAIIYADENLLSPLGYLPNGKRLLVGNPRKINPNLVPLIVYGRLGFIEIKDIRYDDEEEETQNSKRGAPKEHDVDIMIKGADEKLSENNSAYLSLHRYSMGSAVEKMFLAIDNSKTSTASGFQSQFIHRQSLSHFFWGAGLDYSSISATFTSLKYWLLSPTFGYTLLYNPLFKLELYGSFDLALNVLLDIKNNDEKDPAPYIYGPQLNVRFILFPNSKWHTFGGIGYRNYTITNLDNLTDTDLNSISGADKITGLSLFVGLGIKFD